MASELKIRNRFDPKNRFGFFGKGVFLVALFVWTCNVSAEGEMAVMTKVNVTMLWNGGEPKCGSCQFGGLHTEGFACSSNNWEWASGEWDNGTKVFVDPLPAHSSHNYALTQVSVRVVGLFDCRNTDFASTKLRLFLQGEKISEWEWTELRVCVCANCQEEINFVSEEVPAWPNFNYSGINELRAEVEELVCISSIQLMLTYTKLPQTVVLPPIGADSGDQEFVKDVVVLSSVAVGMVFLICISLVGVVIVRRCRVDDHEDEGYQKIPQLPELLPPTKSNKKLRAKYASMFQVRGDEITLGARIGKGSYGEVFRAEWRGILVAVKRLPVAVLENKEFLRDFYQEATIMSSLRHPHVLQFLGTCMINSDICIVTEYMCCGSIHKLLHDEDFEITWEMVKKFALDTAQGMLYLHDSKPKVLHRDLKSHNLLCDDSLKVKISDFGLSKVIENANRTMTSCGTAAWAAPEVLKNSRYTEKADVYSYGVCLWEFVTRKDPYEGMPTFQIIFAVGTEALRPIIPENCPTEYGQLIKECWDQNSEKRPSFEEIVGKVKRLN